MYWCRSAASALGRREVVSERLLDDNSRALRQAGVGELLHDLPEQERRDLEVEDGRRHALDRRPDPFIGGRVGEVPRDVRETFCEAIEHRLVELLARSLDRRLGPLAQVGHGPVVDRDADDRAVEQPTRLEAIERPEGHHLRQVACDSEHDEHVAFGLIRCGALRDRLGRCCRRHPLLLSARLQGSADQLPSRTSRPRSHAEARAPTRTNRIPAERRLSITPIG